MEKVPLSIAVHPYDRVRALLDGSIVVEGCDCTYLPMRAEEAFVLATSTEPFDVTEMSFSTYMISHVRGHSNYIAIPVFLSRMFRHGAIYVNEDSDIWLAQDLRGRQVGVPEYQMTAALWVRGFLQDDFGVKPDAIHWRTGGLEQAGRKEKVVLDLPATFDVKPIAEGETLCLLAREGKIDAIVSAREPSLNGRGMRRLFTDIRSVEEDYFNRTRIFPIMHVVMVRRALVETHPWLPQSLYEAFCQAKQKAITGLRERGVLEATLPWLHDELDRTRAIMGDDFWPYGIEKNRAALETAIRHAHEQGLISQEVPVEALFASGTDSSMAG
jgi:4,5-dihydroxyphthalate decarboxylase